MRLLYLEHQPCIRALKYAQGLKSRYSPEITFAYVKTTLSEFYGQGDELFDRWIKIKGTPKEYLKEILGLFSVDLIHSHNAPDYLTVAAIEAVESMRKKIPVVHDVHDLISARTTSYGGKSVSSLLADERIALTKSDGVIFVSSGMEESVKQKYGEIPAKKIVFPSYLPENLVPAKPRQKIQNNGEIHIVYEGTLDSGTGSHYDLIAIFRDIAAQSIHIHIYPSKEYSAYRSLTAESPFIHYHEHLSPLSLLEEITQYDFGWAGFNETKNREHLEMVFPNKAVEYVSAGLPIVTFDFRSLKKFIEEHNVGLVCKSVNDLGSLLRSKKAEEVKREVEKKRFDFTIEKNIQNVWELYHHLLRK
jgi:glycosyltransferase involved in cell wall biosynthesis